MGYYVSTLPNEFLQVELQFGIVFCNSDLIWFTLYFSV
jgi:hypothetical protein